MGVYIANMEKPSCCALCFFPSVENGKAMCDLLVEEIGEADMLNDCPLIEIDDVDFRNGQHALKLWKKLQNAERSSNAIQHTQCVKSVGE